jgi:hypothetical protein
MAVTTSLTRSKHMTLPVRLNVGDAKSRDADKERWSGKRWATRPLRHARTHSRSRGCTQVGRTPCLRPKAARARQRGQRQCREPLAPLRQHMEQRQA